MSLFNLFKKDKIGTIPPFESNLEKFSKEKIADFIAISRNEPNIIPPVLPDDYVISLINQLSLKDDIQVLSQTEKDAVKIINLSINRIQDPDYVSISYAKYNPALVFITTAPYPFVGDAISFNKYCNVINLAYPFIQIGAIDEQVDVSNIVAKFGGGDNQYTMRQSVFAVRTVLPILGINADLYHLETCVRSLPIYGYDLKDGYHTNDTEPYPDSKTGISNQLFKICRIHNELGKKFTVPSMVAINGAMPMVYGVFEDCVREKVDILNFDLIQQTADSFILSNEGSSVTASFSAPYLDMWSIDVYHNVSIENDKDVDNLCLNNGIFSYPDSLNNGTQTLKKASVVGMSDNSATVKTSYIFCMPNKMDIQLLSWQLGRIMSEQNLNKSDFNNKSDNTSCN